MAFASKSEQRLAGSINYRGSDATLNGDSYRKAKTDMGNNGPRKLYGTMKASGSNTDGIGKRGLYGNTADRSMTSGVAGNLKGDGFPDGPKWKRAMEPGELEPGKASQAKNTVRMKPGGGNKSMSMKTTGSTPKALRGGKANP